MDDWHRHAVCRTDPALWLDATHGQQARAGCTRCPVLEPCRVFAKAHRWNDVTIAGWTATPAGVGKHPPWR